MKGQSPNSLIRVTPLKHLMTDKNIRTSLESKNSLASQDSPHTLNIQSAYQDSARLFTNRILESNSFRYKTYVSKTNPISPLDKSNVCHQKIVFTP